ncbi:metallophosphoesterase [Cupriavidus sp. BIC8F]|uniref:metallophosphoesterase n=1 Tax=Cupriavidus sp. BIC8F TaxID=3079014 RepID=UPI002915DDC7|nr:metallophosphoesterase [Cupriavidus sp. BIC8F]
MKLRILSDLHIEHNMPQAVSACDADIVVLAGDIANGRDGIDWAARIFSQPVVYVPGNHEYYESNFDAVDRLMTNAAAAYPGMHLLNGSVAEFAGVRGRVRIIGTTWWTDYALFGTDRREDAMQACAAVMLDHRLIEMGVDDGRLRHFTPQDALARHLAASDWLGAQLAQPYDGKTVVVTHHGPDLGSLDPRYSHDLVSGGFLSRRPDLVAQTDLWIHGHTHTSFDYCIDDSRVVCNPRGYVSRRTGEPENPRFDWGCVIDI